MMIYVRSLRETQRASLWTLHDERKNIVDKFLDVKVPKIVRLNRNNSSYELKSNQFVIYLATKIFASNWIWSTKFEILRRGRGCN